MVCFGELKSSRHSLNIRIGRFASKPFSSTDNSENLALFTKVFDTKVSDQTNSELTILCNYGGRVIMRRIRKKRTKRMRIRIKLSSHHYKADNIFNAFGSISRMLIVKRIWIQWNWRYLN